MAEENNDPNEPLLPFFEVEEDDDEEESSAFSLLRLVETLIENRLFRQTVENSMETYNNELFRKRDDVRLSTEGVPWTAEDDATLSQEEKKCFICLDAIEIGNLVVKLECKHIFHHACVQNAVAHQHFRCPLCRQTIATRDVAPTQTNSSGHRVQFPEY